MSPTRRIRRFYGVSTEASSALPLTAEATLRATLKRMKKLILILMAVAALVLAGAQALAAPSHSATKVTVVMRDPGCHWFAVGKTFKTTLAVKGPVSLVNYDEAALRIVGPTGVKRDPVGKSITLGRGVYKITMVGQAPDDNHLKLTVS
jgi:hypothetical protein